MILYHGSNVEVRDPKIITSDKGKDFGAAFYLTPIKEQAERMARRTQKKFGGNKVVSCFEWDEKTDGLKVLKFDKPDMNWLEMIINCRKNPNYVHGYDIVEGKIADDNVGETVLFVVEGIIKKEDAIDRLKFQKINSQIAFCSDSSLLGLTFVESYEIL